MIVGAVFVYLCLKIKVDSDNEQVGKKNLISFHTHTQQDNNEDIYVIFLLW